MINAFTIIFVWRVSKSVTPYVLLNKAANVPSHYSKLSNTQLTLILNFYVIASRRFALNLFVMAVSLTQICITLCLYGPKNITHCSHVKPSSQREKSYASKRACKSKKMELNKKQHCAQTHNPCRGFRLRAKIRKWRVALLQVVTRGLSISSLGSHSSLTLESASGKATLDIMKHSLVSPLSSLCALSLPQRIFWLKPFYNLL